LPLHGTRALFFKQPIELPGKNKNNNHLGTIELIARALKIGTIGTQGFLRENLVHPKDKLPRLNTKGALYHIACDGKEDKPCPVTYIGETSCTMKTRFKEQNSATKMANSDLHASAIKQQAVETGHLFREQDITILDTDANWHARGIWPGANWHAREAAYIRGLTPQLNRDSGRHPLPHHFDAILKEQTKPPPQPDPIVASIATDPKTILATNCPDDSPTIPKTFSTVLRPQIKWPSEHWV
jgi:hypothetical protein